MRVFYSILIVIIFSIISAAYNSLDTYAAIIAQDRPPYNYWEINAVANSYDGCKYRGINMHRSNESRDSWVWNPAYNSSNIEYCNMDSYIRPWFSDVNNQDIYKSPNIITAKEGQRTVKVKIAISVFIWRNINIHFTNIKPSKSDPDSRRLNFNLPTNRRKNENGLIVNKGLAISKGFLNPNTSDGSIFEADLNIEGINKEGRHNLNIGIHVCNSRYPNGLTAEEESRSYPYRGCDDFGYELTLIIKPNAKPPADIRDHSLSYESNPLSQIKNNTNQKSWTNKIINIPVGGKAYFKHTINGNFNSNYSEFFLNWTHHTDLRNPVAVNKREFGGLNRRSSPLVYFEDNSNTAIIAQKTHLGKLSCESISYNWSLDYYYMKGVVSGSVQQHQRTRNTDRDVGGRKGGQAVCFYVPYEYELIPCIRIRGLSCGDRDIPAEPGESIPLTPNITGGGPIKPGTIYKLTKWRIGGNREGDPETPNKEIVGSSDSNTCSIYNSSEMFKGAMLAGTCSVEEQRDNDKFNNPFPAVPEDAKIGERFCAALSVSPYLMKSEENKQQQDSNSLWRHSRPICIIVVKKPKMQIWNGGVSSQNGIQTSRTVIKDNTFGSWVEYSAISNSEIKNFGSGAFANNIRLSFANTQYGAVGNFGQPSIGGRIDRLIQSIKSKFGTKDNDGSDGKGVMVLNYESSPISNLGSYGHLREDLNTSVIYGKKINIHYNREIKNIGQQMIIVADEIYIHPRVKSIDAWLIARNKVVTCAEEVGDGTNNLRDNSKYVNDKTCGGDLKINGAVLTKHLKSFRTYGRISTDDPAEIYNQRPDMYFWGIRNSNSSNNIKTTYTKELPVRY